MKARQGSQCQHSLKTAPLLLEALYFEGNNKATKNSIGNLTLGQHLKICLEIVSKSHLHQRSKRMKDKPCSGKKKKKRPKNTEALSMKPKGGSRDLGKALFNLGLSNTVVRCDF